MKYVFNSRFSENVYSLINRGVLVHFGNYDIDSFKFLIGCRGYNSNLLFNGLLFRISEEINNCGLYFKYFIDYKNGRIIIYLKGKSSVVRNCKSGVVGNLIKDYINDNFK